MDEVERLVRRLGGVASRRDVEGVLGRSALDAAVCAGTLHRLARGRYALPTAADARAAAQRLGGTAILLSAAAHWGWAAKWPPERPQVAVPPGRTVESEVRATLDVRWRAVPAGQRFGGWVTTPERTVVDCCALLPFDEALCVVDSALRSGDLDLAAVRRLSLAPRVRTRVDRVLSSGSELAHGPFESVLRAIAVEVPGLVVRPQVRVSDAEGFVGRVDLADERLRIVIEADSNAFHAGAEDFARDCERYSRLTADGWLVIRVPWRMAMREPERVRRWLQRVVALRSRCVGCTAVRRADGLTG